MRKHLKLPPLTKTFDAIAQENRDANLIVQTRHYKLITPLFGGGVEPGVNDEVTPISGKAIRGQLRFWWRATRGTGILKEMKEREDKIWGAASSKKRKLPSEIQIEVIHQNIGKERKPFTVVQKVKYDKGKPIPQFKNGVAQPQMKTDDTVAPPYAAFPLQPPTPLTVGEATKGVGVDMEFTLQIRFRAIMRKDIEASLWGWETLGGIGGRTRRGFGAVELVWAKEGDTHITPEKMMSSDVETKVKQKLKSEKDGGILADGVWDKDTPRLSSTVELRMRAFNSKTDNNFEAWKYLIKQLQKFRQSREPSSTKPQGRSHWPEPDMIRKMVDKKTGATNFNHRAVHKIEKFPRAQFGLPIMFHFNKDEMKNNERFSVELKPTAHKRLGSPLILRPVVCANGESVGMGLILETSGIPANWVELDDYGKVKTELDVADIKDIDPMEKSNPTEVNVLKSFLKTIK